MKHKSWAEPYLADHAALMLAPENLRDPDFVSRLSAPPTYLEIGTGKGGFIAAMAAKFPNEQWLGIERIPTAMAYAARRVVDAQLTNVRLILGDATLLLEDFPEGKLMGIYLNFSDPWPKKRHAKRRLTYGDILARYAALLAPNGILVFKSDNDDLYTYSRDNILASGFVLVSDTTSYDGQDPHDAPTEYETKFRAQGVSIKRLVAKKGPSLYAPHP